MIAVIALSVAGCQARSSVEAAQTAVVAAQTALPVAQVGLGQLETLLGGASVSVKTTPDGADGSSVTDVAITGTDTRGSLSQLDPTARQAGAEAALALVAQHYPNAKITLTVVDAAGATLVSATRMP